MIIYRNTKGGFIEDCRSNRIQTRIEEAFFEHNVGHNNFAEYLSWANSMQYMRNVLDDNEISDDCNVAVEYQIPLTGRRIDFLIAGADNQDQNNIVVVELKQWESSEPTSSPGVVRAYTGGALRTVAHPCYQAYSYAKSIECFNEAVVTENIHLYPCAYLHNYKESQRYNIDSAHYADAVKVAPIFLNNDCDKLNTFIKQFVRKRAEKDLLMTIENGKLRPSKSLQDTLSSMLHGNEEFFLIDEQKVVFELVKKALHKALSGPDFKYTIIIQGGPGTGKSVVAIQLLCDIIKTGRSALYVTKNAAPRHVYFAKLRQNYTQSYINTLFKGSGAFIDAQPNTFDCILADEAHRLQMKSGMYQNQGEAQVKEIINASKVSVFFIDEQQRVTTSDACTVEMIRQYAKELHSNIIESEDFNLTAQFRCNGSDAYLALISNILGMKSSPNTLLDLDYDIQVFDSPTKMREALRTKNDKNKARMLAGYCYEWKSKKDPHAIDIQLADGFAAQWNFDNTNTWAIDPNSFDQVGCIHTSQGLEFDYVGVIIGKDLVYKDGKVQTDFAKRAHSDKSLFGIRAARNFTLADTIIRNTYKTLLTRGQKGCYIYCEDKPLADYIRQQIANMKPTEIAPTITPLVSEKASPILQDVDEDQKYISLFPVYTLRAACGYFGDMEPVSILGWLPVPWNRSKDRNKFIVQAVGHSMEPRIHDGDYCLFERYTGGSREGKIVLAEHHGEVDSDYEGAYSIKVYHSKKVFDEDGYWQHESITLQPLNRDYNPISINAEDAESFRIIGEFVDTIEVE